MTAIPDPDEAALLEEAALWCFRLADDSMSEEEQQAFDGWLESDACRRAFDATVRTWHEVDAIRVQPQLLAFRAAALADLGARNRRRWSPRVRLLRPLLALTASLLVALLGYGVYSYSAFTTYLTRTGERRLVLLDDGSRLSLDADSSVKVRYTGARRELELLRGRAKFDVARDSLRPFTVTAGSRIVVATGTEFSVELLTRQLHVILYEGRVNVVTPPARAEATGGRRPASETPLEPGRELVANLADNRIRVRPAGLDGSLSWEAGFLTFANEPLQSAVERINRYTAVKFAIADVDTARLPVSGVYPTGNAEAFVEGVTGVLPVRLELRHGVRTFVRHDRVIPASATPPRVLATADDKNEDVRLSM